LEGGKGCPVRLLQRYLAVRGKKTGPLFVYEDGKPLTRNSIVSQLKEVVSELGLDARGFNTQTFLVLHTYIYEDAGD